MRGGGIFQEDVFVFVEFGCVFDLVEQDLVFDFWYNVLGDRYFGLVAVVDLEMLDGLGVGFGYVLIFVKFDWDVVLVVDVIDGRYFYIVSGVRGQVSNGYFDNDIKINCLC